MHLDRQRAGEGGRLSGRSVPWQPSWESPRHPPARYLGDEAVKDMARRDVLFEVAGERPGADLLQAPRTVPVPLVLVGITVAALAEAMQIRAANEPPITSGTSSPPTPEALSGLGQITADAAPGQADDPAVILFPPALLRPRGQVHRWCRRPGRKRRQAPGRIPEAARGQLAATLRRDADGLTAITITGH